jgi:hypothetical protein
MILKERIDIMSNINKTTSEHSEKINVKFIERDVQTNEVI